MSMERLTHEADFGLEDWEETLFFVKSDPNGAYNILDIAKYQGEGEFDEILKNIAIRLSEIENILGDTYDLDRLWELVEADKAGRCVVFPCKNWLDIVFGEQEVFYGIDKDYEENPIREISVDSSSRCTWYNGWESVVLKGYEENGLDWEFSPEDIGKTVFLTREAAEAALAKEADRE